MTYAETLEYLYQSLPMYHRIGAAALKPNLTNTLALCAHLGNPERQWPAIHVAGTNGKGSTSHYLAAILQAAGYRTGLYTSPHLRDFTERIRLDGREISPDEVTRFVADHRAFLEQLQPSFFEMTVGMAFDFFARQAVDIAVVEVGLGGRLDSTNVITPVVSVITTISYDHVAILGDTLPQIAAEKAGIIKPSVPVVISERQPEVEDTFVQKAARENAPLTFATDHYVLTEQPGPPDVLTVDVRRDGALYLPGLASQLTGSYQLRNLPGVLQAVETLQGQGYVIGEAAIRAGIGRVVSLTGLKGRWQTLATRPRVIADAAHNEDGLRQVVRQLRALPHRQLRLVLGVVNDKDLAGMLALLPLEADYYFCQANIPRALPAADLLAQATARGLRGQAIPDVNQALAAARAAAHPDDLVFVGGSTFVVAELTDL